jgi:hypothetical protein
MWRFGVPIGSVLVLLLAVTAISDARAPHKPSPRCPRAGTHMITADSQAQVFLSAGSTGLSGPFERPEIFGCTYAHKRSYLLGEPPHTDPQGSGGVELETLAGSIVAYTDSPRGPVEGPIGDCGTRVYVRDLRDGRVLHDLLSGVQLQPHSLGYCKGVGPVTAVVIKSDGAVAWTAFDFLRTVANGSVHPEYFDLYAADQSGEHLVASGTEINPYSLALAGSTLYWTQDGKPMSAPLN